MSATTVGILIFLVVTTPAWFVIDLVLAKRKDLDAARVKVIRLSVLIGDVILLVIVWLTGIAAMLGEAILEMFG